MTGGSGNDRERAATRAAQRHRRPRARPSCPACQSRPRRCVWTAVARKTSRSCSRSRSRTRTRAVARHARTTSSAAGTRAGPPTHHSAANVSGASMLPNRHRQRHPNCASGAAALAVPKMRMPHPRPGSATCHLMNERPAFASESGNSASPETHTQYCTVQYTHQPSSLLSTTCTLLQTILYFPSFHD